MGDGRRPVPQVALDAILVAVFDNILNYTELDCVRNIL
jgi:hypothetical protein